MSLAIDIKSKNTCLNSIKDYVLGHIFTHNHVLFLIKYNYECYSDINIHLPKVLTNIIIQYNHEIYEINCNITKSLDDHHQLTITNEKLNINFQIDFLYGNRMQIYNIDHDTLKNIKLLTSIPYSQLYCFVNYYLSKKSNIHLDVSNFDNDTISLYDIIIKRLDHKEFMNEFMNEFIIVDLLFNKLNPDKN